MNKHPYIGWTMEDRTPRQIIGGPLTGWMTSDAVRQHKCPKCGSDPGYHCESPGGRSVWPPHTARLGQLTKEQVTAATIKPLTLHDVIRGVVPNTLPE